MASAGRASLRESETLADLAVRVVVILRHDGGPLRGRDILAILQETGMSFISEKPVCSVVGALNVAREPSEGEDGRDACDGLAGGESGAG